MNKATGKAGRIIIANLKRGSDLLQSMEELAIDSGIEGGIFTAIGAVSKASYTFYDQKSRKYINVVKNEELEVVSCSGSFGVMDGRPKIHCHIVFSDVEGHTFGGHLLNGTEVFVIDLHLVEVNGIKLKRKVDATTGIAMLDF